MATTIRYAIAAAVIGFTIWTATEAPAQDYPNRTIRIVVPFSAGGGTDILARLLGQRFHDGYTLMLSTASTAVNARLYPKLPFDLRRDLIAISQMASAAPASIFTTGSCCSLRRRRPRRLLPACTPES